MSGRIAENLRNKNLRYYYVCPIKESTSIEIKLHIFNPFAFGEGNTIFNWMVNMKPHVSDIVE